MKINEMEKEEMGTLVNPYYEPGKRLLAKKTLSAKHLARLLYMDQASSFWCALYDQDYPRLIDAPPYDKLEDRDPGSIEYLNKASFLLNWLRSFVIKRGEYETNAFIHLKTLEALLVEARKNEDIVTYSRIGEGLLFSLRSSLINNKANLGEEWPKIQETLAYLSTTLGAYKNLRDGFLLPDPGKAFEEADEAGEGYEAIRQKIRNAKNLEEIEDTMEDESIAFQEYEALKDRAEKIDQEAEDKMELLEETFSKLTKYILFLRGSRIVMGAIAKVFKSTPDAWVTKPEHLEDLEKRTRQIIDAIAGFTTRIKDGKRQTLEEAAEEKAAFDKMEGGPERIKLLEEIRAPQVSPTIENMWLQYKAGSKLVSHELETRDTQSLLETKAYWRGKAIELNKAINKTWRPFEILKAETYAKGLDFMGSQSDMDYIWEFCGVKEP